MRSVPICIVIPCYNEEQRLPVEDIKRALQNDENIELCLVNDGSSDGTGEILKKLALDHPIRVKILELEKNSGKAEAVRQGMLKMAEESTAEFIGYFDADLATPLEEARSFVDRIPADNDVVMIAGSRVKLLGSTDIRRLWYRHYFGRIFATTVSTMLGLAVYDTQCGAKLFRNTAVKDLFEEAFISKWLFDVEIFYRCLITFGRKDAARRIYELNVSRWFEIGGSKIEPGFLLKIPVELWKIRRNYASKIT